MHGQQNTSIKKKVISVPQIIQG